jgi:predicted metal-dependent HD superfamily phosphohydrolase
MQADYLDGFWSALSGYELRYYHSWRHVKDMLTKLDIFSGICTRSDLIMHAIFWHDAVYQTVDNGNYRPDHFSVEDSVQLFNRYQNFTSKSDAEIISLMISGTADHLNHKSYDEFYTGFNKDLNFFIDLDLSSLAAPYTTFLKNNSNIRKEFAWMTDKDFYAGQMAIMNKFLSVPCIFWCSETRAIWERAARTNISRYITELKIRIASE